MYSGIVSGPFKITDTTKKDGLLTFTVNVPSEFTKDLQLGASVGIDGVCLTVIKFTDTSITFDAMQQTLDVTTLDEIEDGYEINLERSLKGGEEIGGHIISGHIDGKAEIVEIETPPNNCILKIKIPKEFTKYVFNKGFIAINGCSLTVAEIDKETAILTFWLIPETLQNTTFNQKKIGDYVNFEVERNTQAMVDTVERFLQEMVEKNPSQLENPMKFLK